MRGENSPTTAKERCWWLAWAEEGVDGVEGCHDEMFLRLIADVDRQTLLVEGLVGALEAMVLADCKTAYPEDHAIYPARRRADALLHSVRKAQRKEKA